MTTSARRAAASLALTSVYRRRGGCFFRRGCPALEAPRTAERKSPEHEEGFHDERGKQAVDEHAVHAECHGPRANTGSERSKFQGRRSTAPDMPAPPHDDHEHRDVHRHAHEAGHQGDEEESAIHGVGTVAEPDIPVAFLYESISVEADAKHRMIREDSNGADP